MSGSSQGCVGRSAAALKDQRAGPGQAAGFLQLRDIAAGLRHRERNAVRGEYHLCAGQLRERSGHALAHGLDKAGVVVELRQLDDFRSAGAHFRLRAGDVFAILAAAGVGTVRRREERKRALECRPRCIWRSVSAKQRMPVAVAPVNGNRRCSGCSAAISARF